jgi:outer membrane biosynthesis protein TonB
VAHEELNEFEEIVMRKQKPLSAAVHAALMGAVTVSAMALAAPAFAAVAPQNDMRPENGMSNMQWPQNPNTAKATKETSTQEQNEQVSPQQEAQNQGSAPSEKAPNGMSNQTWQNQAEHLSSWEKDFFWQGNTPGNQTAANRMAAKDSEPITHWG